MKKLFKFTLVTWLAATATLSVGAQSLLPSFVDDLISNWQGANTTDKIRGFIRLALTLAFGVVILAAVAYSIMSAIKYIRSQGDAGKVEEANKAIKAIFQGVAMMFVGIIGVVIVFFIFDVAIPSPSLPTVCVACPNSDSCTVCSEGKYNSSLDTYELKGHSNVPKSTCNTNYSGLSCPR
jgi:hypothetical protein